MKGDMGVRQKKTNGIKIQMTSRSQQRSTDITLYKFVLSVSFFSNQACSLTSPHENLPENKHSIPTSLISKMKECISIRINHGYWTKWENKQLLGPSMVNYNTWKS